jgi:hypothetical protein
MSATVRARSARSGLLRAIICAALLAAEAMLPHAVRGGTPYAEMVAAVRDSTMPTTGSNRRSSHSANDSGNGPPRSSCHQQFSRPTVVPSPRSAATPMAGARKRAMRPSWATEAATRRSTLSGAPPRARADRTRVTRPASTAGSSTSSRTDRHGDAATSSSPWCSAAKKGPRAARPEVVPIRLSPSAPRAPWGQPRTARCDPAAPRTPTRWCPTPASG